MSGIPGVPNMLSHANDICGKRETLQNQPGCLLPATQYNSVSERVSKVCTERCSHSARNISSSTVLQSLTEIYKFCTSADFFQSVVTEKFSVHLLLSQEARADLIWWAVAAKEVPRNLIFSPVTRILIESDASNLGWGDTIEQGDYGQLWNQHTT